MAQRGRKPNGANLVERLDGSQRAKTRLTLILETLSGKRTIADACRELGIHETMFHKMRAEVLQTALGRLEPRPLGRPPRTLTPQDLRLSELEGENVRLEIELKAAEARRQLAESLPRLSQSVSPATANDPPDAAVGAQGPGKKTTQPTPNRPPNRRRPKKRRR
jgi:transposase-like protein